jgi:hypothetical protein
MQQETKPPKTISGKIRGPDNRIRKPRDTSQTAWIVSCCDNFPYHRKDVLFFEQERHRFRMLANLCREKLSRRQQGEATIIGYWPCFVSPFSAQDRNLNPPSRRNRTKPGEPRLFEPRHLENSHLQTRIIERGMNLRGGGQNSGTAKSGLKP